jgi:DNA-binding NarL/FixJ family response regulator
MAAPGAPLRIVVAEDAAIMRDGLTQTLTRRGHEVVAAVGDAEALRQAVEEHRPDVAIIDVRMPPTHTDEGLRAALAIHQDQPGTGVLVFSQYIETQSATELFARAPGGVGYLLKDRVADVSDFIDAITRVAHGGTVLDPEVVRQLLSASRRGDTLAALTPGSGRCSRSSPRAGRTRPSRARCSSPRRWWKSTSRTSSTSSAWPPPTATTAASSPPSGTWSPDTGPLLGRGYVLSSGDNGHAAAGPRSLELQIFLRHG